MTLHAISSFAPPRSADGDQPTVVCLHSSGSSSSQWKRLIEALQGTYRSVALDFYGHGRAEPYNGRGYTLRSESDRVWRAIEPVPGPLHLVGHSFGGAVALDIASRFADRVASVCVYEPVLFAVLDPSSSDYRQITAVGRSIVRSARAGRVGAAAAEFVGYWNGSAAWASMAPELRSRVEARMGAVASHFEALFDDPVPLHRIRPVTGRIRVLHGDRSPDPAQAVCRRLGSLDAVDSSVLDGFGHMAPVTHPDVVNRHVALHLRAATRFHQSLQLAA
jgi:pimeloyl-ACP methyl ester carboxylesterase